MFYFIDNSIDPLELDIRLLNNFFVETNTVLKSMLPEIEDMTVETMDEAQVPFSIFELFDETFNNIEKERIRGLNLMLLTKDQKDIALLDNFGLRGKTLAAKLQVLDWLLSKCRQVIYSLKEGLNLNLFTAFFDQLYSLLKSILAMLGIHFDPIEEIFTVIKSLLHFCA